MTEKEELENRYLLNTKQSGEALELLTNLENINHNLKSPEISFKNNSLISWRQEKKTPKN